MVDAEVRARVSDGQVRPITTASGRRGRCWVAVAAAVLVSAACTNQTSNDTAPTSTVRTAESQENPEESAKSAAIDAFTNLLRVTDAAAQDPLAQDWEPEIRKYAADPAAYAAVQSVRSYATLGLHQVGTSHVELQVTAVDLHAPGGPAVSLSGCFDSQASQVVHTDTDEPVASGTPPRFTWLMTVVQYESEPGKPWLVTSLDPRADRPC
jgi:hypothetical protein